MYDAAGQRVKELIGNVETEYIVDHLGASTAIRSEKAKWHESVVLYGKIQYR